jgi:hypothetical protein
MAYDRGVRSPIRRIIAAVVLIGVVAGACGVETATVTGDRIGFGLSPRSYEGGDLPEFLDLIDDTGDVLMHAGDWRGLATEGNPFEVTIRLAEQRGLESMVVLSANNAGALIRPLDDPTSEEYLDLLRTFLGDFRPDYLGLGNEVNMLATDDPAGFATVVDLWSEARAIVDELAPDTTVFVTLQYEWLIGRRGGWFGGTNDPSSAQWDLLDRFRDADAVAFTTYPSLVFDKPDDLGADYYRQIASHTDLPVIFSEVGWTADATIPLLPGDEREQAAYVDRFLESTAELDREVAVWSFVWSDLVDQEPFAGMGLRDSDGRARPAWERWVRNG